MTPDAAARRATNSGPYPAQVPKILRYTTKGIRQRRTNRPEGDLKRAEISHKRIRFVEQAHLRGQFRSCNTVQADEVGRWGELYSRWLA